jgi:hypothetical protein
MNTITINPQGWYEDFDAWLDIELRAGQYEEIKRLEEEHQGIGWDDEE